MKTPDVKHPRRFRISGVEIEVVTLQPLSEDAAARVALDAWKREASIRRAKGKRVLVHWLGNEALAATLPALPRPPG